MPDANTQATKLRHLRERWQRLDEIVHRMREQYDRETRVEERLRLGPVIEEKERDRDQVEAEIHQLGTTTSLIPDVQTTPIPDYRSFDVCLERTASGVRVKGWDQDGRIASVPFEPSWDARELKGFRREEAKASGGRLFKSLFHGELLGCLRASLEEARAQDLGLRLRLRFDNTPELTELPWEVLFDASLGRFLALSIYTPVARYLELPERVRPLSVDGPLRILVLLSSPRGYKTLDIEGEWSPLARALRELDEEGRVVLERLDAPSLVGLQEVLRRGEYHVFHFVGHGGYREGEGHLIFHDRDGGGAPVNAESLGVVLHDHKTLRLAVLNACGGARSSSTDPFSGVAQTLVRQGIPAVVAMQAAITEAASLTLAQQFYGALADGYPVDACLTEARKVLAGAGSMEWGIPVLYLRAPDGRIFEMPR